MAVPIQEFSITSVGKPRLGEEKPAEVLAEIQYNLGQYQRSNYILYCNAYALTQLLIKNEWDTIKLHDVLFLVTLAPKITEDAQPDPQLPFTQQYGVKYIRGCEVKELLDEEGNYIRDFETANSPRVGLTRTVKVLLDTSQYQLGIHNTIL
jgi:intron-binding protein aquarius